MNTTHKLITSLRAIRDIWRASEALVVDVLAGFAPWIASAIPAYLAWTNMTNVLQFSPLMALIGAAAVEVLSLSAINTLYALWDYNSTRRDNDASAPIWPVVISAIAYASVILTVNVILDAGAPTVKLAKLLLSTLSIWGSVIIAVRATHTRRLDEQAQRRQQQLDNLAKAREAKRAMAHGVAATHEQPVQPDKKPVAQESQPAQPEQQQIDTRARLLSYYRSNPSASAAAAGRELGISRQRVSTLLNALEQEGVIHRNGKVTVAQ